MGGGNERERQREPIGDGRAGSGGAVFAALKRRVSPADLKKQ
jgi:hypothetical protein